MLKYFCIAFDRSRMRCNLVFYAKILDYCHFEIRNLVLMSGHKILRVARGRHVLVRKPAPVIWDIRARGATMCSMYTSV